MKGTDTPIFLDKETAETRKKSGEKYVDAFSRQLRELFFLDNPSFIGDDKEAALSSQDFVAYETSKSKEYEHVYYPWNQHIVKTVRADDYYRLKTNRNQDLITTEEQKKLYAYRVAVLGLSVGSNIAYAITQAGISQNIVIADFDELDTTNLNRIPAGVHQIGLNKAVIAARRIYEENPFADVVTMTKGVDTISLEAMLKEKSVDCIIDEVDDMPFKIEARKLAITYRIPVVMVTDNGDGIVLHVERYDLGLDKIFGKNPDSFADLSEKMSKEEAGKLIMETMVGGADRVDPAMLASVKRVLSHELVSWSQLGSAALLGGVAATYIVKQIALGKSNDLDIRAYIAPSSGTWSTHTQ